MGSLKQQLSAAQSVSQDEITKAFFAVFATTDGKRVLHWMLEQCAVYQDAFSGEATAATNYTLGLQAAGRRLMAQMDHCDPTMYPALLLAMKAIRETDAAHAEALTKNAPDTEDLEDDADLA
jgi:hypothetical protein